MRKKHRQGEEPGDVNVTPLLDIVFIMLIFFIVTATFVYEDGISPNLPQKSDEPPDGPPPPSLLLTVKDDGFVLVDSTRQVDPRSVKAIVEEFFAKEQKGVVIVSALPDSKTGVTMTVIDQARQAGGVGRYSRITLTQAGA